MGTGKGKAGVRGCGLFLRHLSLVLGRQGHGEVTPVRGISVAGDYGQTLPVFYLVPEA